MEVRSASAVAQPRLCSLSPAVSKDRAVSIIAGTRGGVSGASGSCVPGHSVEDEDDLERCEKYVHWTPRNHGLVTSVCDWRWSSFHRFVEEGYYDINWCGTEPESPGRHQTRLRRALAGREQAEHSSGGIAGTTRDTGNAGTALRLFAAYGRLFQPSCCSQESAVALAIVDALRVRLLFD